MAGLVLEGNRKRVQVCRASPEVASLKRRRPAVRNAVAWSLPEEQCLLDFLISKGFRESWPTVSKDSFWQEASQFLAAQKWTRTGGGCKVRVNLRLRGKWASPSQARENISSPEKPAKLMLTPPVVKYIGNAEREAVVMEQRESTMTPALTEQRPTVDPFAPLIIERCERDSLKSISTYTGPPRPPLGRNCIKLLFTGKSYDYTIPSFSVITVRLRHVHSVSAQGNRRDIFIKDGEEMRPMPVTIKILQSCTIKTEEFSRSVDLSELRFVGEQVLVVWQWEWRDQLKRLLLTSPPTTQD